MDMGQPRWVRLDLDPTRMEELFLLSSWWPNHDHSELLDIRSHIQLLRECRPVLRVQVPVALRNLVIRR